MQFRSHRIVRNRLYLCCVTPETLHTLRREEITDMKSHIIVIIPAGIGVPLSTGPSTILFDVWFYFILLRTDI